MVISLDFVPVNLDDVTLGCYKSVIEDQLRSQTHVKNCDTYVMMWIYGETCNIETRNSIRNKHLKGKHLLLSQLSNLSGTKEPVHSFRPGTHLNSHPTAVFKNGKVTCDLREEKNMSLLLQWP